MAAPDLLDGKDEDGFTPLHLAVIAGNIQLVTFLLANSADVNAVDNEKHTVVHWATVCGETAALRAVLAAGAPVSTPDVHGGYPLHYAAQMCGGDRDSSLGLQVLQTLLSHGDIVVSVADGDKRQPLLWAASAGSARAVLALVRAGANVEAADKDGLTALHCAASRGHTDCMDTLLTLCGASIDVIDSNGCTALHYAVTLGHADATALLLAHGADPNRQDRKGRSPAHCGCAKGQFETVKLIGSHGANLWLRNARGDLPLHDAAASGRRELVKWLLEMRPSHVNARNNDGRCPLHMAALNDNSDMCKILLDAGAQINPVLRTSKNIFMTPLDCALQRGFRSTAKYLQLQGGVPATRLRDPRIQPVNPALNLQIRDDINLWGGTSSDSERENGEVSQSSKKVLRKKLSYKHGRRKLSLSGSEVESVKEKHSNNEKSKEKSSSRGSYKKSSSREESAPSHRSDSKKLSSSRLDYTNEIIINGKTEINIRQTEEIVIDKNNETADVTNQRTVSTKVTERDRRPKSAKYSRVRDKSARKAIDKETLIDEATSPETVIQQDEARRLSLKDQSTNTSEEKIVENKKFAAVQTTISEEEATPVVKKSHQPTMVDQHSVRSYTSEETEEQKKELIVEASVHAPPKSLETIPVQEQLIQEVKSDPEAISNSNFVVVIEEPTQNSVNNEVETVEIRNIAERADDADKKEHSEQENVEDGSILIEEQKETEEQAVSGSKLDIPSDDGELRESNSAVVEKEDISQEIGKIGNYITEPDVTESVQVEQVDNAAELEQNEVIPEEKKVESGNAPPDFTEDRGDAVEGNEQNPEVHFGEQINSIEQEDGPKETQAVTDDKHLENDTDQAASGNGETILVNDKLDTEEDAASLDDKENDVLKKTQRGEGEMKRAIERNGVTIESKKSSIRVKMKDKNLEGDEAEEEQPKTEKSDLKRRKVLKNDEQRMIDRQQLSSSLSDDDAVSANDRNHKSFRILDDKEAAQLEKCKEKSFRARKSPTAEVKLRPQKPKAVGKGREKVKKSKIPTPLSKSTLSKSDRHLNEIRRDPEIDHRVPSLPNITDVKHRLDEPPRCDSNMSAPLLKSVYSDNERDSFSEGDEPRIVTKNKRRVKKRTKTRESRSAGSDYESSNLIDSGFEPSPRSTRIPKWKNMSERGVNMTSVTQNIQNNIRRYHLERKIFQQLLELKRHQIRAGQHNEAVLVKRAVDTYHQSCASTVGAGRYIAEDYTFKSFEKFLYEALRKLQRNGADHLRGLPETQSNPLLCTRSTNKCMHAVHAYTGVPCAAYLPKMDHHSIPKIGFNSVNCKPGTGFLPTINPKKAVTLELSHGTDKQVISLPTDRLEQNKRYYVTFTVKGHDASPPELENSGNGAAHRHSKSD
nr:ankyrin repeat domain-containing protein 12 isoform X1 [Leptinotarsa decemlineata]